jgi:hypothetical protein
MKGNQKMNRILQRLATVIVPLLLVSPSVAAPVMAQSSRVLTAPPKTFPVTQGWYQGRETFYYDFGANTPPLNNATAVATSPIYVLVTGFDASGNPQPVPEQYNIVDVVPGDQGYSDLWQVNFVTVPAGYVANTLKSGDEVRKSGYAVKVPGLLVNCPVVPLNSKLAESTPGITHGWYKGQEIHYFDFGPNTDRTAPIYAFITGMDAAGNPQFVEGQHNIIDVIPGDAGYSAFWDLHLVQVPAGYKANSITSMAQVTASGYTIAHPGIVVNCPVIRTTATAAMSAGDSVPGMPTTGGPTLDLNLYVLLVAGLAVGAGFFLRRRFAVRVRVK